MHRGTRHLRSVCLSLHHIYQLPIRAALPEWLSSKASACNAQEMGLSCGPRRFSGVGNSNPL